MINKLVAFALALLYAFGTAIPAHYHGEDAAEFTVAPGPVPTSTPPPPSDPPGPETERPGHDALSTFAHSNPPAFTALRFELGRLDAALAPHGAVDEVVGATRRKWPHCRANRLRR